MKRDWTRRRAPLALAVAVVVSVVAVVAVVSATTTREGVALSIAIDLAIACVTTLSQPDLKSSHPVVSRAALTLLGLDVAIFITFSSIRVPTSTWRPVRRCRSCCSDCHLDWRLRTDLPR